MKDIPHISHHVSGRFTILLSEIDIFNNPAVFVKNFWDLCDVNGCFKNKPSILQKSNVQISQRI